MNADTLDPPAEKKSELNALKQLVGLFVYERLSPDQAKQSGHPQALRVFQVERKKGSRVLDNHIRAAFAPDSNGRAPALSDYELARAVADQIASMTVSRFAELA